jgi:predicted  nucleic acid-binding Zn-ribbon protein
MPTLSELFRTIHRLRQHVRGLQTEIDRGPLQLKARQTHSKNQAAAAQMAKDALKKKQVEILEMESELKSSFEQQQKYKRQLNEAKDPKAYEALQHEIATTQAKCAQLEESILAGMTEADEMKAAIPAKEDAAKKAAADLASFDSDQKAKLTRLAEENKKANEELKAAEAQIPNDIRPEYSRRVASYGADALAAVEDHCCSFCRTAASAQQVLNLQMGQYITCTSCYRLLYLPE